MIFFILKVVIVVFVMGGLVNYFLLYLEEWFEMSMLMKVYWFGWLIVFVVISYFVMFFILGICKWDF